MAKSSVVDSIRSDLERRAAELRRYVAELADIEAALRALDSVPGSAAGAVRSGTRRAAGSRRRRGGSSAGERAPRGQRRQQMLEYVQANPGVTVRAVADVLGISPSQAHGLVAKLGAEGTVERREGKLYPTTPATPGASGAVAGAASPGA